MTSRIPNLQENAYAVNLQSSGAASSNAAFATLAHSAPTVLAAMRQALTSDPGDTQHDRDPVPREKQ